MKKTLKLSHKPIIGIEISYTHIKAMALDGSYHHVIGHASQPVDPAKMRRSLQSNDDYLTSMMKEMIEEKRAFYIPWIEDEDLPALYQAAHSYICTSTVDGEALMLKEAMQSGTPVITSPLLKDAIGGNGLIIDDPTNILNTSKILRIAMSDDLLRNKLIKDGKKWTQNITWERVADKILTFLESR